MQVAINDEIEEEENNIVSDSTDNQSNSSSNTDHVITADEAIELCGGFGKY